MRSARRGCGWLLLAILQAACAHTPTDSASRPETTDSQAPVPEPEFRYSDCDHVYAREIAVMDYSREKLAESLCLATLWLDGLFGKRGDLHSARRSHGRLELTPRYSERDGWETDLRLRVEIDLPTLEDRLSAFVGREPTDDFITDRAESLAFQSSFPELRSDDKWLAGLGYSFPGRYRVKSDFRVGVRGLANTTVFAKNRFALNAYADERHLVHLNLTPFWTNEELAGITGRLDVSRILSDQRMLRLDTVGTRSQTTEGIDWRTSLLLYQGLRRQRGIAFEAYVRGESGRPEPIIEYGPRLLLRLPALDFRLMNELVLTYAWRQDDPVVPREGEFRSAFTIGLYFGGG